MKSNNKILWAVICLFTGFSVSNKCLQQSLTKITDTSNPVVTDVLFKRTTIMLSNQGGVPGNSRADCDNDRDIDCFLAAAGSNPVAYELKVYDLPGNEITTLVNDELTPGEYEVGFNSTNLPGGIYFYHSQVGSFIQTKNWS